MSLAQKQDWAHKIPQMEDGTYDCDVFGGDHVKFEFDINITGNLYLGDLVDTLEISAGGDVILGKNANTLRISAGGDVILGENSKNWNIDAGRDVILFAKVCTSDIISADGEILFNDEPA